MQHDKNLLGSLRSPGRNEDGTGRCETAQGCGAAGRWETARSDRRGPPASLLSRQGVGGRTSGALIPALACRSSVQLVMCRVATVDPDGEHLGMAGRPTDVGALRSIYEAHGPACFRLAARVTGSTTMAQDVVQEVFVAFWRNPSAYDAGRGGLRSWLMTLTHHKAVDLVRGETSRSRRELADGRLSPTASAGAAVEDSSHGLVENERVRTALERLPFEQRQVIVLAYFAGYTQSEIARATGLALGTVKTRTLAGMRRLRAIFADEDTPGSKEPPGISAFGVGT